MLDPVLTKAVRSAKRGNYTKAIELLSPEAPYYRDSVLFPYLFGLCYLRADDFANALPLFRKAASLAVNQDPLNVSVCLALAVLHLRRGDGEKAAELYLKAKDADRDNRIAKRGLAVLKKNPASESLLAWARTRRIASLYPPFPKIPLSPLRILAASGVCLAVLAAGLFLFLMLSGRISLPRFEKDPRPGLAETELSVSEKKTPVETSGYFRFVLTSKEVLETYNKGHEYFNKHNDDAARREMNRILESTAAEAIKNKAKILLAWLETPDFTSLTERFSYKEVHDAPWLYAGCHVLWKGRAANIVNNGGGTSFDLLVGSETLDVYEGTAKVVFENAIQVNTDEPVEILGRVVPLGSKGFTLQGVALHQSASFR